MGIGMPKFVVDRYNNFKETCHHIREGWRATKLILNLVRKVDISNVSQTQTADEFLEAVKNTDDLPEGFRNLLSSVDSNTIKAMLRVATEAFTKASNNPSEPVQTNETISKMADVMAESRTKEELRKDQETLDRLQEAAEEHSKSLGNNSTTFDASSRNDNTQSRVEKQSGDCADQDGYIPNETQKTIFNMAKKGDGRESTNRTSSKQSGPFQTGSFRTAREFQDFTNRKSQQGSTAQQAETTNPNAKNLPPLTKFLGKEMEKRFGTNWRNQVPPFMKNPNASPIPDLGLGLSKEGNKDMVVNMSKVLKDLI